MLDHHLTEDDMGLFTRLRLTAFGQAVIDIAYDPAYDEWTFSQKIRHALEQETAARSQRRMLKLLKESKTPNPAACVEDIHYLPDRSLNREVIARLASCRWIEQTTNLVILGKSSVGKSYLAQAMVNAACRRGHTARYFRLDDLANQLAVHHRADPERLVFLQGLHDCEVLVLDDFLTTPITPDAASELLNILAGRENRGATVVTSQFDPEDWYKSLHDAVIGIHPQPHRLDQRAHPARRTEHAPPHPHRSGKQRHHLKQKQRRGARRYRVPTPPLPDQPTPATESLG